jgi:hypothetical protein
MGKKPDNSSDLARQIQRDLDQCLRKYSDQIAVFVIGFTFLDKDKTGLQAWGNTFIGIPARDHEDNIIRNKAAKDASNLAYELTKNVFMEHPLPGETKAIPDQNIQDRVEQLAKDKIRCSCGNADYKKFVYFGSGSPPAPLLSAGCKLCQRVYRLDPLTSQWLLVVDGILPPGDKP